MKKVFQYIGIILWSILLAMQSCTDSVVEFEPGPDPHAGDKMVPISLDISGLTNANTYGTDYDGETRVPGSNSENSVNDIIVYIFDHSFVCEKILIGSASPVGPEMVKVGTKNFLAVVNGNSHFTGTNALPTTPASTNYSALRQKLSDATSSLPTSPFLMTGEKLSVPITELMSAVSPNKVELEVERTCAKVTMSFTKSGLATAHNITINKVTLYKGANKIYLFDRPTTNDITYTLSTTKNTFSPASAIVENSPVYISLADSFYTHAVACGTDTSKAVRFEIEAAINSPTNTRIAKFFLAEYKTNSGDTVYDIKRNFWYDIKVNMVDPGMDSLYVTVNTCPWNLADVIPDTVGVGGQYETATPFKLVKNYTAADLTGANKSFAAIARHTKGASWINLKVSKGAGWELFLKDDSPRNQGVIASSDGGATWTSLIYNNASGTLKGTGTDLTQRIYIYRPYREDSEPDLGPSLYLKLNGQYKWDFIIQPRDTLPIPTNSYVLRPQLSGVPMNETRAYIPLAGVYRVWEDYLLANGDSIPDGSITANLLWKDNTGEVIKTSSVSVINPTKRDSAYIYLESGPVQGNAVVEMKVGATTYWSFHIWVTEYNPYEVAGQKLYTSGLMKNVFMDRNLGALMNEYDVNGYARGLFYQFGRKDPYPRGTGWGNTMSWYNSSGTIQPFSPQAPPTASTVLRPLATIPGSLQYPMRFYTMSGSEWALNKEISNLWMTEGGHKTAFDPCPEGWRVPKQEAFNAASSPWTGVTTGVLATGVQTNGRYSAELGYYPFSGYISGSSITGAATSAYFWSSWSNTSSLANSTGLQISTTAVSNVPAIQKNWGVSVRCVVDTDYLYGTEGGGLFGRNAGALKQILPK